MTRICAKCKEEKPIGKYSVRKSLILPKRKQQLTHKGGINENN